MDGTLAIERNCAALKRIVASLFAMAGLAWTGDGAEGEQPGETARGGSGRALDGSPSTLPRRRYNAILRLLRPAESAARRLVIAAARKLMALGPVTPERKPKPRLKPEPSPGPKPHSGASTRFRRPSAPLARPAQAAMQVTRKGALRLPLVDPLRRPFRRRRRTVPAHAGPRISVPGITRRASLPPPPTPDDPIDATQLRQRLAALAAALDDLPGHARRFARWQASRDARDKKADAAAAHAEQPDSAGARNEHPGVPAAAAIHPPPRRWRRLSPLRTGRPPGGRFIPKSPSPSRRCKPREIDTILADAHSLALDALTARRNS